MIQSMQPIGAMVMTSWKKRGGGGNKTETRISGIAEPCAPESKERCFSSSRFFVKGDGEELLSGGTIRGIIGRERAMVRISKH